MGRTVRSAAAAVCLLGASCGADGSMAGGGTGGGAAPLVLATTSIWADVTANVACDELARVEPIIPVGVDSHSFEPSLADRGRLESAALVVANGLGLEEALADTLDAAESDGAAVFTVADALPSGPATAGIDGHGDDPGHDHGEDGTGVDPHIWLDPRLVAEAVDPLSRALIQEAGLDPAAVEACAAAYRDELERLDREVADLVAGIPPEQRLLVTSHRSFGYFAERYGFEVIGTIVGSTSSLAEANPGALEELASLVRQTGVDAIFTDEAVAPRDAQALADRVGGVAVVPLHTESLGEAGSPAGTYLGLVRDNARRIVAALGGAAP